MNPNPKNLPDDQRVVVTGLGVVSSIGIGWQEFWKNLIAGKSGIKQIKAFDTSQYDHHMAGEVHDFNPLKFISLRKSKSIGRTSQMTISACKLALEDAKLKENDLERITAVCIGTTMGEIGILERFSDALYEKTRKSFSHSDIPFFPSSSLSAYLSIELKLQGKSIVFGNACASGNYALGKAFELIRTGKIKYALAGGADQFSRIVYTGFNRLFAVAPEKCQPFDANRKGMIPGEGAGMMIVESLDSARRRKARIYAEILGYGMSCDAQHMTIPSSLSIAKAIMKALESSLVDVSAVDYINAHGTGTIENDKAECDALIIVFGSQSVQIPTSSIKSMLGHTMGAASALESIACCLAIADGNIPPTINLEKLDKDCNIDCVPNKSRKSRITVAINNSQAFGGNNACIVFRSLM